MELLAENKKNKFELEVIAEIESVLDVLSAPDAETPPDPDVLSAVVSRKMAGDIRETTGYRFM